MAQTPRPLTYVIVIDGLDGDRVDQGEAPFIKSLIDGGVDGASATYYKESRSTMVAETNPNHTSMATGAYGGSSGIPGNSFAVYGQSDGDTCPAAVDESKPPTVTDGQSPSCVDAQTLFESLDRQAGGDITTAGIFGKPKLGRIFAGTRPDSRLWADYLWAPCEGSDDPTPYCKQVPTNPITGYSIDDAQVMDELIRTVKEGVPADGGTKRPDYTFVNLPQVDSAGHATGTGPAYTAAIVLADREVERFVQALRDEKILDRSVILLVSDHSMDTTGNKISTDLRFRAAGIDSSAYTIVLNGSAELIYLNNRTDPGRFELLKRMRAAALGLGGATEALYREPNPVDGGAANTLDAVHPAWKLAGPRAGDLVVTSGSGSAFSDPINPLPGNHGGPQTRDNFMAVIGGTRVVKQSTPPGEPRDGFDDTEQNPGQSENVDVAPTIARALGYRPPEDAQGRALEEAFNVNALPAAPSAGDGGGSGGAGPEAKLFVTVSPKKTRAGKRTRFTIRVRGRRAGQARAAALNRARVSFGGRKLRTNSRGLIKVTLRLKKKQLYKLRAQGRGYAKRNVYVRAR
jgi:hypothetical protein